MKRSIAACAGLLSALAGPALSDPADWEQTPFTTYLGDAQLTLGGHASASLFTTGQPQGPAVRKTSVTGFGLANARLERIYDSGLVLGGEVRLLAQPDALYSGSTRGAFQHAFVYMQTGLGRVALGLDEGPARLMGVTGPKIDPDISIDDPQSGFFRDPATGRAFATGFAPRALPFASSNYAKLSYRTPEIFGVQLGLAFTPSESKQGLPFLNSGRKTANAQEDIWEFAATYAGALTDNLSFKTYGGYALAHNNAKTPGHAGLTDWAFGLNLDYALDDENALSWGGAFHSSNAYQGDLNNVLANGSTDSLQTSIRFSHNAWSLGAEFGAAYADGLGALPRANVTGYQVAAGYRLNANIALAAGWQQLTYKKAAGVYYSGLPRIGMDAGFLHLNFDI